MRKASVAAQALTEAFFSSLPKGKKKQFSEAQWTVALQQFHRQAADIRTQQRLGLLSSAMATYQFQKQLLGAGIEADVVRKVVFSLLLNAFNPGK